MSSAAVQQALHVPASPYWSSCNAQAGQALSPDEMIPSLQLLPDLIANYRVLLYNGNFDMNCGASGTETYLNNLLPSEYGSARRKQWVDSAGHIAGYYKNVTQNLAHVIVFGAGHMVPMYQPANAYTMIMKVLNNEPWL